MGTYIGKVQIGNDSTNLISLGDTLYGTCNTPASTAIKEVILPAFDRVINGVQIRVRFDNGNTATTDVALKINNTNPVIQYGVIGSCTCSQNEVISFTWEQGPQTSYWRVNSNGLSQTVKDYVSSIASGTISMADAMVFKGTIGINGDPGVLPSSGYKAGWTYRIITPGTYANVNCEIGDIIIAIADGSDSSSIINNSHWTVIQTNIDGAVIGPTQNDNNSNKIAIFDGTTGKIIKNSGFTVEASVPANAVFTDTTYTLNMSDITAYTGNQLSDTEGTVLANVENGVLKLAKGIKFITTTTAVGTSLTP